MGLTTTDDECANVVRRKEPTANAATRGQKTGPCYAGFGATATDNQSDFRTCFFDQGQLRFFQTKRKISQSYSL